RVMQIQDLGALGEERFDGIVSAFASLSALPDLGGFAQDATRLVRPGGCLVLHMLNRFSLWEFLGYVARREFAAALQVGHVKRRVFVLCGPPVAHSPAFPVAP